MLVTPDQIRAARALKNWSQAELAERVDMATPSIGNIESGKHVASPQTQAAILEAFNDAGIEFINGGVRKKQDLVQIYEGEDCYLRLLDDVFRTLSPEKGEVLFSGSDESRSPNEVVEKVRAMKRSGIKMRSLIRNQDNYIMGPLNEYKWMPEGLFVDSDVKVIFGDAVGYLVSWQDISKVILIKDQAIASEARRTFEHIWNLSDSPTTTEAIAFYQD